MPLFITEGARKADAAVSQGACCVALLGVWNFRGTNEYGGKVALPDWESVALNGRDVHVVFDSDVMLKVGVHAALARLKPFLESRSARVSVIYLPAGPDGSQQGLDDFLAGGHGLDDLLRLASRELRAAPGLNEGGIGGFRIDGGCICRLKHSGDSPVLESLCNFTATVTEELSLDDGIETTRAFLIEGRLANGKALSPVRVPAATFSGMNWVTEAWGFRAVVKAGSGTRDLLREGIQRLSSMSGSGVCLPTRAGGTSTAPGRSSRRAELLAKTASRSTWGPGHGGPPTSCRAWPTTPWPPCE